MASNHFPPSVSCANVYTSFIFAEIGKRQALKVWPLYILYSTSRMRFSKLYGKIEFEKPFSSITRMNDVCALHGIF